MIISGVSNVMHPIATKNVGKQTVRNTTFIVSRNQKQSIGQLSITSLDSHRRLSYRRWVTKQCSSCQVLSLNLYLPHSMRSSQTKLRESSKPIPEQIKQPTM